MAPPCYPRPDLPERRLQARRAFLALAPWPEGQITPLRIQRTAAVAACMARAAFLHTAWTMPRKIKM